MLYLHLCHYKYEQQQREALSLWEWVYNSSIQRTTTTKKKKKSDPTTPQIQIQMLLVDKFSSLLVWWCIQKIAERDESPAYTVSLMWSRFHWLMMVFGGPQRIRRTVRGWWSSAIGCTFSVTVLPIHKLNGAYRVHVFLIHNECFFEVWTVEMLRSCAIDKFRVMLHTNES